MTIRDNILNILNFKNYERVPVVHFGYWNELLIQWYEQGHITLEEATKWGDGNEYDKSIAEKLGFDYNWSTCFGGNTFLNPYFERTILEELPDGGRKVSDSNGVIVLEKNEVNSIPMEFDHLLKDRETWEKHYKDKFTFSKDRINYEALNKIVPCEERETPLGIFVGSLFGNLRNIMGVVGSSYIYADDEDLFDEIININAELTYKVVEEILVSGVQFDFAHFWEDICFRSGPLINPSVFDEKVGPHYKKITNLLNKHNVNIVSLDCDGQIDALLPTWLNNGVNTMFPIEVGVWDASIKPWRGKYGKKVLGVGGMDKKIFLQDKKAVDVEIERMKYLIDLGGYIPCPDHRIPQDAKWELVQYYCEQFKNNF